MRTRACVTPLVLDLSSPTIGDREIGAVVYGPVTTTMLGPVTVLGAEWDRAKGIWPDPARQPAKGHRWPQPRMRRRRAMCRADHADQAMGMRTFGNPG